MIKKWRRQSYVLWIYIGRFEIFISISRFALKVFRICNTIWIRFDMQLVCTCNKQILIQMIVLKWNTVSTVNIWLISLLTDLAHLSICIVMTASQAIGHLNGSFSTNVQLHVSAKANRAVIIDTLSTPFLDLFGPILDIIVVAIFIVKETLSAHFAPSFIACSTILTEILSTISAFSIGMIIWVNLFDVLIYFTIKAVTLQERHLANILCCTRLEHR